jgi:sister-chromatid-cohesion protein PDS5
MLVFAIIVLAHHPEYTTHEDIDMLKRLRNALWFVMEPLMVKNDNFSFGFYKVLIEKMKNQTDTMDTVDEAYNTVYHHLKNYINNR